MHWGLPCSKEKIESKKLHEVVQQAPMQQRLSLAEETPTMMFPTCDDGLINVFEQDSIKPFNSSPTIEFYIFLR
jgi:hypothetical protein